jgi:hypothetical protein
MIGDVGRPEHREERRRGAGDEDRPGEADDERSPPVGAGLEVALLVVEDVVVARSAQPVADGHHLACRHLLSSPPLHPGLTRIPGRPHRSIRECETAAYGIAPSIFGSNSVVS